MKKFQTLEEYLANGKRRFPGYRLDDGLYESCAAANSSRQDPLGPDEVRNIAFSSDSLAETRKRVDDVEYVAEAEMKTYPARKFVEQVVRRAYEAFGPPTGVMFNRTNFEDRGEMDFDGKAFVKAGDGKHEAYVLADVGADGVQDVVNLDVMIRNPGENRRKERDFIGEMMKAGSLCGYDYVSHWVDMMSYSDMDVVQAVFEARRTEPVDVPEYLYHMAPTSVKDRILKYGIVPKSKSKNHMSRLEHPDRVYLFTDYDERVFSNYEYAWGKGRDYSVFRVDRKAVPGLRLYRDGMVKSERNGFPLAVYTYQNVPPSAVMCVKDFKG